MPRSVSGDARAAKWHDMRDNPVKRTLAAGDHAFGAMVVECFSAGLPRICKNAGADFLLYDMEHTGLRFDTLKTQLALCRGLGIVPMATTGRVTTSSAAFG